MKTLSYALPRLRTTQLALLGILMASKSLSVALHLVQLL